MNTAQKIAYVFRNDGQCFENNAGLALGEVCNGNGARTTHSDSSDTYRYDFPDGSCITVAGDGWDFGYPDCFCWQGEGHSLECYRQKEDDERCQAESEAADKAHEEWRKEMEEEFGT